MDLKISISEDTELRAWVKDLIRGQVKSILNDLLVKDLLNAMLEKEQFKRAVDSAIDRYIAKEIEGICYPQGKYGGNALGQYAREQVLEQIKDIVRIVK